MKRKISSRERMEIAATFLAKIENSNSGANPKEVDEHLSNIRFWKKWFVHYLTGKPNLQVTKQQEDLRKEASDILREYADVLDRRSFEFWNVRASKEVKISNLTKKDASSLADNIFLSFYS